jgi:DNA-3-methyladenine glycosylase II
MLTTAQRARIHLGNVFPGLEPLFEETGPVELSPNREILVAEAVTKIVVGQMLSKEAAASIYQRIETARDQYAHAGSWKLDSDVLKACGLSGRKVRTIKEFGSQYDTEMAVFEAWRNLPYSELVKMVSSHWGLSQWSADMLAIFYFGLEDVFPKSDGTIVRAIKMLQSTQNGLNINSKAAKPFRTYLSLYLWRMIDLKIL